MSMTGALQVVQAVVSLSFLVLGASTVIDWLRRRERNLGYLALALGTLGLTSVLGQFNTRTEYRFGTLMGDITLVLLMTSGYALLLFRDSFIPLSRRLRIGALALCVAVTAPALAAVGGRPASGGGARARAVQSRPANAGEARRGLGAAPGGRGWNRHRRRQRGYPGAPRAERRVRPAARHPRGRRRSTAPAGHQRVGSGERDSASPPARRRDRRHGSGLRSIYALLRYRRGQSPAGVRREHHGRARPRPGDRTAGRPREDQEPVPEPGLARAAPPAGGDQRLPLDAGAGCVRSAQGVRAAGRGGVESPHRRTEFAGGADARCGASRGWTAGVET